MADLRIVDAPEIPTEDITGQEKLPTGGSGNYSITLDSVADYTKTKKDLADNTSVDGKVNGVRQELDTHIEDSTNPHQVTKDQIGLSNVDNTADADKPVSNSTQAAIISAVAPKADKTYVDSQDSSLQSQIDQKATAEYLNDALFEQTQAVNTALSNLSTVASKFYPTLAEANADIANIAVNQPVNIGEVANGGLWYKDTAGATTLIKSPHDPLGQAKAYTDSIATGTFNDSASFSIDLVRGGNHYYAKAEDLIFDGYITSDGVFTASSQGYKTSDFILVDISKPLVYSLDASSIVSGISFWDTNKAFISSINTNNNATPNTVNVPLNAKFIRVSNYTTDNPNGYVYSTFENVLNQAQIAKEYSNVLIFGGDLIDVKPADFVFSGHITNTGSFTASEAGYKTTDFILLDRLSTLTYSLDASSIVSAISYWDVNKNFIGYVTTNNVSTEAQSVPPENTKYIRVTNNMDATPNPYLKMTIPSVTSDPNLVKSDDLTIEPSLNLADPALIISDKYVNNAGTITNGVGWKYIKIPVTAGETYTFGNFVIDIAGFYTFQNVAGAAISGSNGSYQTGTLPRTVIAPATAGFLLFDIARPTNLSEHYAQLMCNVGASLEDYVDPSDTITAIKGKKIAGSGGGSDPTPIPENIVVQGGNATLADIIADSVTTGALIANLPTSATGLEVGQAWVDTASGNTIKVVMA